MRKRRLDETKGIARGKERKMLQKNIEEERLRLASMKKTLVLIVKRAGYYDIRDFVKTYEKV